MAHSQEADTAPFLPTDPSLGWGIPLHSTVYDWVALVQYSQVVLPLPSTGHWQFARLSTRESWEVFGYRIPFPWTTSFSDPFVLMLEQLLRIGESRPTDSHLRPGDYLVPVLVLSCPP